MKRLITQHLKQLTMRLTVWFLKGILGLATIVSAAFVLVEWASGCGESYVDSKGVTHANECVWTTIRK